MKDGPLNEEELEWLEDVLIKYGNDESVLDVAELDGMLTAILSGPNMIEPSVWLVALWGGEDFIPDWESQEEVTRFMDLTFQHMNDIADRLNDYPEQFEPLFGEQTVEGTDYTVVDEWCYGYMRGIALDDWSSLPAAFKPSLEAIELHGLEKNMTTLEGMTDDQIETTIEEIKPAALNLHGYWLSQRQERH
ncbi:UPF0149 family protein [Rouxiella chamberiensis]|uniref:UPF0149 family protein n=1 Tax=Rouxiella chamberiensis TaxID=1513468 RepID=A0ABY7HNV3_9GAMM|nr:UPF0149 family protein [Rouxiella chamberiensis]WAT01005.1 UPF0149 family protein [Rouxiella chamberiensis]